MAEDQRDRPRDLGNSPMDDVAERQFRVRTAGQGPERKAPGQKDMPSGKGMNHSFRASTGHAQTPVWEDDKGA